MWTRLAAPDFYRTLLLFRQEFGKWPRAVWWQVHFRPFTRKPSCGVNELASSPMDESSWMQKSGSREYLGADPTLVLLLRGIFGNRLTSLIFRTENFLSAGEVTKRCDLCWKEEESGLQKFLTLAAFMTRHNLLFRLCFITAKITA